MREFLLVTIIALTASQSFAVVCPPDDGTAGDILLPNPADCTTFYKCLNGVAYLMPCPGGLEWSDELKRCDYPDIAQCEETDEKPSTVPTTTTSVKPRPDKCPAEDGPDDVLLPNPADCGSFFKCLNGVPHLIQCPVGQEWSVELNRCDFPEIAKCVVTGTTTSTKPTVSTSKPPKPDKCPAENGPEDVLLPNPEDCGSFFKCLNGIPHLIPCPPGQEWSIELSRCDYPEIAQCSVTGTKPTTILTPTPSTSKPPVEGCPAEDGPEDVLLPNPKDCGSFYKCLNGIPHLILCPAGLDWSVELNRCDYPEIAQCKENEAKQIIPLPKENGCPAEDGPEDVLLPNPADCGTFFKCFAGVPILQDCPAGLEWSVELNRCDYPEIAQCKENEAKQIIPLPKENGCPAEDGPEDVLLPNPADCGTFFKCFAGVPILQDCPAGLEWSVELNRCDYPEIAQCKENEAKQIIPLPKENGCPAEDGPEDVLLPNPADCGTFFKCFAGVPILQDCPAGLEWSVELNRCDYPEIAQCKENEAKQISTECPLHNKGYDVFVPNLEDCSTYYLCSNGVKILMKCPEGTLWSAEMTRCDHAANAQCA